MTTPPNEPTPGTVIRNATVVSLGGPAGCEDAGRIRKTLCLSAGRVVHGPIFDGWVCDLTDHLIFPGLINAHDHLHINAIPPLPETTLFRNAYEWSDRWRTRLTDPDVLAARAVPRSVRHWHGGLKNLLSGVTTVAHHDPADPVFDEPAFPVNVVRRFGWAHSLGLGERPTGEYGPRVRESFAETPEDQPWIIHLAEGVDSVAAGELAALDQLGCLRHNTVLVHGVGLTESDIRAILGRKAAVVWCPTSNLGMFGRTLDPTRLSGAGRLALATDSRISGAFDMLAEMRTAAEHSDITPAALARMVTDAPSRILRAPDAGGLRVGQRGDLLIVADTGADPYRTLIDLERRDIRAVVRGGLPAVADPDFADWFDAFVIPTTLIALDKRPKLIATALLGPPGAADMEPNLALMELHDA